MSNPVEQQQEQIIAKYRQNLDKYRQNLNEINQELQKLNPDININKISDIKDKFNINDLVNLNQTEIVLYNNVHNFQTNYQFIYKNHKIYLIERDLVNGYINYYRDKVFLHIFDLTKSIDNNRLNKIKLLDKTYSPFFTKMYIVKNYLYILDGLRIYKFNTITKTINNNDYIDIFNEFYSYNPKYNNGSYMYIFENYLILFNTIKSEYKLYNIITNSYEIVLFNNEIYNIYGYDTDNYIYFDNNIGFHRYNINNKKTELLVKSGSNDKNLYYYYKNNFYEINGLYDKNGKNDTINVNAIKKHGIPINENSLYYNDSYIVSHPISDRKIDTNIDLKSNKYIRINENSCTIYNTITGTSISDRIIDPIYSEYNRRPTIYNSKVNDVYRITIYNTYSSKHSYENKNILFLKKVMED